jgi:hypothetical protein
VSDGSDELESDTDVSEKVRGGLERALPDGISGPAAALEGCGWAESRVGNGITDVSVMQIVVEDMLSCNGLIWLDLGGSERDEE